MQEQEEFPCAATAKLNDTVAFKYLRASKSVGGWSRVGAWMTKFFAFAKKLCQASGKFLTPEQCVASGVMCRHFIATVANEGGVTRPRSARAALSKYRQQRGWTSLNSDDAISAIVRGHEAATPRTRRQSAGFSALMVRRVAAVWGKSVSWWKRQIAAVMTLGFVSIMRLGEMCTIRRSGVRVVFNDGSEADVQNLHKLPASCQIKGLLFHLPWRKNHLAQDCWVPVACQQTIQLVLTQVRTLRRMRCPNRFLFPSREFVKGGKQAMNAVNWMGEQSWVNACDEEGLDGLHSSHDPSLVQAVLRPRYASGWFEPHA